MEKLETEYPEISKSALMKDMETLIDKLASDALQFHEDTKEMLDQVNELRGLFNKVVQGS